MSNMMHNLSFFFFDIIIVFKLSWTFRGVICKREEKHCVCVCGCVSVCLFVCVCVCVWGGGGWGRGADLNLCIWIWICSLLKSLAIICKGIMCWMKALCYFNEETTLKVTARRLKATLTSTVTFCLIYCVEAVSRVTYHIYSTKHRPSNKHCTATLISPLRATL